MLPPPTWPRVRIASMCQSTPIRAPPPHPLPSHITMRCGRGVGFMGGTKSNYSPLLPIVAGLGSSHNDEEVNFDGDSSLLVTTIHIAAGHDQDLSTSFLKPQLLPVTVSFLFLLPSPLSPPSLPTNVEGWWYPTGSNKFSATLQNWSFFNIYTKTLQLSHVCPIRLHSLQAPRQKCVVIRLRQLKYTILLL
jgi:hypothetical protein